jgi:tRNA A-37 threonylcarbamoyl transferase component Bud32
MEEDDDDNPTIVDGADGVAGAAGVDGHIGLTELTSGSYLSRAVTEETQVAQRATRRRARRVTADASRFHERGRIGIGGMGDVRKAYDQVLQRQVAMKNLLAQHAHSDTTTRRFFQEVLITAQLDHPNIVPVYDVGFRDGGSAFFVMKLVRGRNLASMLREHQGRALTSRELERYLRIFLKVCEAVDFAHSRGVIHRDLKPSNVMVGPHGEVYVMDWGIALVHASAGKQRAADHSQPMSAEDIQEQGMVVGTAAYMAPEQARGDTDDIDPRTDIFALGGILYHILTERPPYPGTELALQIMLAAHGDVLHPTEVVTDRRLPPQLCRIAMKAMARRREDRYQSVPALVEDIEAFLRGGGWFDAVSFPAGTLIIREGDEPDAAYIIEQGHCEVFTLRDGRRHHLRHLGPGEVFGETSIFTGVPRTASVVALDDVRAASITREDLDHELAEKGWLAAFVRGLAERFRSNERTSMQLRLDTTETSGDG